MAHLNNYGVASLLRQVLVRWFSRYREALVRFD